MVIALILTTGSTDTLTELLRFILHRKLFDASCDISVVEIDTLLNIQHPLFFLNLNHCTLLVEFKVKSP